MPILLLSRHNKSYADTNISYSYRKGSSISTKSYSYGTAFKEKTTASEGIACNSFANCYVGCSCQSGWTQGSVPTTGEYVWATDGRYTGVNSMSAGGSDNVGALSRGASTQSANSNAQVVSLNGGVSTMGSSGGMTCYKAACDSGYYLDTPNSTYFKSTSKTGTIGLTCYKATGCQSGYYNGGSSQDYHGYKCSKCTYSCPSGYYEATTSCPEGYTFQSTSATTQSGCAAKTCGKCVMDKPEYYKVRVVLVGVGSATGTRSIPVNTRLTWNSQSNDYISLNTEYETYTHPGATSGIVANYGVVEMGLSCYNGITDSSGKPLFPTIIVNGELSAGGKDKSFSYEINCGWPRASLEGKIGSNGTMVALAGMSPDQDSSVMNISDLEVYISGIGYVDTNDTFTYNGKNYKIQFDITKDKRGFVGSTGKPSSLHPSWDCPNKGTGDTSWPNCD